jgi:hypothetical protein
MANKTTKENVPYEAQGPGKSASGAFSQTHLNAIFQTSPSQKDRLVTRESSWLEFKKAFNWGGRAKYTRTCAAFANTKGGFIVFGVGNNPRTLDGLQQSNFDEIDPEKVTDFFNEYFAPEIEWYMHIHEFQGKSFGLLYVAESRSKPIICTKTVGEGKDIKEGEIYYRYRGRTQIIRYPELRDIIEVRRREEQLLWLKHLKQIARVGVREAGIFDLNSGEVSGAGGTFVIDESLLDKLKFIKEGEFSEKKGAPAVKIIGNAEVVGKSMLPMTQKIFKTKAIRTPDIIRAFLENNKVDSPEEYLCQICFESSGYLPVYYFMRLAKLTLTDSVKLLQKVKSTSTSKAKLIDRISSEESLGQPIPTGSRPAGNAKLGYRQHLITEAIDLDTIKEENDLKYLLQAVRTISPAEVNSKYLRPLLLSVFDAHYAVAGSLSGEIRTTICYLDYVLNRNATE